MELNLDTLRKICTIEHIEITLHAAKRLEQRGITLDDIISCIRNGKIIEQYPDDYPFPSCLILGLTLKHQHLHVVIGSDQQTLWIVTAYYPSPSKWDNNFQTRKETNV